jgi:hypothetical protein
MKLLFVKEDDYETLICESNQEGFQQLMIELFILLFLKPLKIMMNSFKLFSLETGYEIPVNDLYTTFLGYFKKISC